jgi:3-isopropylmalate/(R)-2-methylmalate dehydratase small subunit
MSLPLIISGMVWRLGDHVNTDVLHPPAYFSLDQERMKEGLQQGMVRAKAGLKGADAADGLVIVAGENFGCGSSRETSVRSLSLCGVRAVIARSFARIFYRSLANLGIPPVHANTIQDLLKDGDPIRLSLQDGFIELGDKRRVPFSPLDPHIERILECGGLCAYVRRELYGL